MRHLANGVTISRIAAALFLLYTTPFTISFYFLYSFCGVSDIADGVIARKYNVQSRFGALLDSIADLIFLIVILIKLLPFLLFLLPSWVLWAGTVIAAHKIITYAIGIYKFRRFIALHTVLNKFAGAILFFVPYWVMQAPMFPLYLALCICAGLAAIEELLLILSQKEIDLNYKSIIPLLNITSGK